MEFIAYLFFLVLGLVFGYILAGPAPFLAFLAPIVLFIVVVIQDGFEGGNFLEFLIGLLVILVGIMVGRVLRNRPETPEPVVEDEKTRQAERGKG